MKEKDFWLGEPKEEGFNWTIFWFVASIALAITWVLTGIMLEAYTDESIRDEMFYGLERAHISTFWLTIVSAIILVFFVVRECRRYSDVPKKPKIL